MDKRMNTKRTVPPHQPKNEDSQTRDKMRTVEGEEEEDFSRAACCLRLRMSLLFHIFVWRVRSIGYGYRYVYGNYSAISYLSHGEARQSEQLYIHCYAYAVCLSCLHYPNCFALSG